MATAFNAFDWRNQGGATIQGGARGAVNPATGKWERMIVGPNAMKYNEFGSPDGNGESQVGFASANQDWVRESGRPEEDWYTTMKEYDRQMATGDSWLDKILTNPGSYLAIAGGGIASGVGGLGGTSGLSGYEATLAGQDALAGSTMINSGALGGGALAGGSGTDLIGAANDVATNAFDSGGMPDYSSPDFNTTNFPEYNPDVPNAYNSASTASGGNLQSIIEQVNKMPGGSSLVSRFLNGNATTADYVSAGGKLLATALGLVGSSSAAKSSTELANKFQEFGAPYRAQLANISTNPDAFYKGPQATSALEAVLRRLSVGGNPAGDPYKQSLAVNSLYGEYGRERDRLAGFGGLTAYNSAAPGAMTTASGSDKGIYDALGYGINSLTNPTSSIEELLAKIKSMGGSNPFGLA